MHKLKAYELFSYEASRTDSTCHDVDVGYARQIEQQPYTLSLHKLKLAHKEIKYLLHHEKIEPIKVSGIHQLSWCQHPMAAKDSVLTLGK